MKYPAILFDLDGTLLPMDNDTFVRAYFSRMAETVEPYGYRKEAMIPALWQGVSAMVQNDGRRSNCEAFWEVFSEILGPQVYEHIPVFDKFYVTEFEKVSEVTGENPLAARAVELAHQKAQKVVLATNPLFPPAGVQTRLGWVGLKPDMFDYWTHYENSSYCKPNPDYYREILKVLQLQPGQCLMIGNDAQEDVEAARTAGLDVFLVTDSLINRGEMPDCPQGDFKALTTFLEEL